MKIAASDLPAFSNTALAKGTSLRGQQGNSLMYSSSPSSFSDSLEQADSVAPRTSQNALQNRTASGAKVSDADRRDAKHADTTEGAAKKGHADARANAPTDASTSLLGPAVMPAPVADQSVSGPSSAKVADPDISTASQGPQAGPTANEDARRAEQPSPERMALSSTSGGAAASAVLPGSYTAATAQSAPFTSAPAPAPSSNQTEVDGAAPTGSDQPAAAISTDNSASAPAVTIPSAVPEMQALASMESAVPTSEATAAASTTQAAGNTPPSHSHAAPGSARAGSSTGSVGQANSLRASVLPDISSDLGAPVPATSPRDLTHTQGDAGQQNAGAAALEKKDAGHADASVDKSSAGNSGPVQPAQSDTSAPVADSATAALSQAIAASTAPAAGSAVAHSASGAAATDGAAAASAPPPPAAANAESGALSSVQTARVLQGMQQTEMRVGMHSAEFGAISISTSLTHQQITAQIALDHSELGAALESHVSGIQDKLGALYGVQARVEVRDTGMQAGGNAAQQDGNTGAQAREGSRQSAAARSVALPAKMSTAPDSTGAAYTYSTGAPTRLSVRA